MGLIQRVKDAVKVLFASDYRQRKPSRRTKVLTQLRDGEFCLTASQIVRLMEAADTPRDALLIGLLATTAMRRHEITSLQWADVDCPHKLLTIRKGKGGKMRIIPMTRDLAQLFDDARPFVSEGPVFHSRQSEQLSMRQLNRIVASAGNRAGIRHPNPRYKNVTCRLLRHTFARRWKEQGGSIESLSKILGHSSVKTTWDVYGTESLADVRRNYANTAEHIYRIKRRR